jgi:hypothetical protein
MGEAFGFTAHYHTAPYNLQKIAAGEDGQESGNELLVIAARYRLVL